MLRKTHRFRIVLLAFMSLLVFAGIEYRLYVVQVRQHQTHYKRAEHQQHRTFMLAPRRGDILDRNGRLLAGSYFTESIVLDTREIKGAPDPQLVQDLARATAKPVERVRDFFDRPYRHYLYSKAPADVIEAVAAIESKYDIPKTLIQFETNSKREYPSATLASHLLGFTTIDEDGSDNIGIAGLEKQYDKWLAGEKQEVSIQVSSGLRRRGLTAFDDEAIKATFGRNLQLTIDQRLQTLTESALAQGVGRFQAKGGIAIVMDTATGEILAMANCPDFNLNTFRNEKIDKNQLKNRILTDPIEVGSVMKIITTTLLLDKGLVSPDEMVNGYGGYYALRGRVIKDDHKMGVVPFRESFTFSSNIIMAMLADSRLTPPAYFEGLKRFGLGESTGIDLGGEGKGIMYPLDRWTSMSPASLAFGYEIALTPLQVISSLGAIGNNGWRMRPHVVREIQDANGAVVQRFRPEAVARVASAETCATVRELMESVVVEGTGKGRATVPGYRVGGKTGTTVKHETDENGRKLYIASFAGLAPIDNPKLAVYVYVDEPRGAKYGGEVAAPIFREIVGEALPLLGVPPSDPAAYAIAQAEKEQMGPTALLAAATHDMATTPTELVDAMTLESEADVRPYLPGLPAPAPKTGPAMPDCRGLTMVEAWDALAVKGIDAQMLGSGICVRQEPRPGARLAKDEKARIIFAQNDHAAVEESTGDATAAAIR